MAAIAVGALLLVAGCDERTASPPPAGPGPEATPPSTAATTPSPAANRLRSELAPFYGLIAGETPDYGAARVRLRRYLDEHPDDGQAEFLFGLSYHREKRYAKARPWYEAALEHAPGYTTTSYFLGWALYYLGEAADARTAFEAHLAAMPDAGDSHFALGLIALDADRLEDAERHLGRALELFGEPVDRKTSKDVSKTYARLGELHMLRGEWERAKLDLIAATELYPDHYEAFYKLSRVYQRLGEEERADAARRAFEASRQRLYPGTRFPE